MAAELSPDTVQRLAEMAASEHTTLPTVLLTWPACSCIATRGNCFSTWTASASRTTSSSWEPIRFS